MSQPKQLYSAPSIRSNSPNRRPLHPSAHPDSMYARKASPSPQPPSPPAQQVDASMVDHHIRMYTLEARLPTTTSDPKALLDAKTVTHVPLRPWASSTSVPTMARPVNNYQRQVSSPESIRERQRIEGLPVNIIRAPTVASERMPDVYGRVPRARANTDAEYRPPVPAKDTTDNSHVRSRSMSPSPGKTRTVIRFVPVSPPSTVADRPTEKPRKQLFGLFPDVKEQIAAVFRSAKSSSTSSSPPSSSSSPASLATSSPPQPAQAPVELPTPDTDTQFLPFPTPAISAVSTFSPPAPWVTNELVSPVRPTLPYTEPPTKGHKHTPSALSTSTTSSDEIITEDSPRPIRRGAVSRKHRNRSAPAQRTSKDGKHTHTHRRQKSEDSILAPPANRETYARMPLPPAPTQTQDRESLRCSIPPLMAVSYNPNEEQDDEEVSPLSPPITPLQPIAMAPPSPVNTGRNNKRLSISIPGTGRRVTILHDTNNNSLLLELSEGDDSSNSVFIEPSSQDSVDDVLSWLDSLGFDQGEYELLEEEEEEDAAHAYDSPPAPARPITPMAIPRKPVGSPSRSPSPAYRCAPLSPPTPSDYSHPSGRNSGNTFGIAPTPMLGLTSYHIGTPQWSSPSLSSSSGSDKEEEGSPNSSPEPELVFSPSSLADSSPASEFSTTFSPNLQMADEIEAILAAGNKDGLGLVARETVEPKACGIKRMRTQYIHARNSCFVGDILFCIKPEDLVGMPELRV